MKTPLILGFIICFTFNFSVSAQYDADGLPQVVLPAPTAAEFIRQQEFPVGKHTGTVNVSVPIYTIKSGDLELPLSATYNSTGIKVNQEASWIGLGWNLNLGGSISRVVRGKDDFSEYGGIHPTRMATELFPYSDNKERYLASTCLSPTKQFVEKTMRLLDQSDLEPDSFYFNFGNHSGQFLLPQLAALEHVNSIEDDGYRPIIVGNSNVDIKLIPVLNAAGNHLQGRYNFRITDVDGTKYYFGTTDRSASTSYSEKSIGAPKYNADISWKNNDHDIRFNPYAFNVSTWHLDSIVSLKNDKIKFEYDDIAVIEKRNSMTFVFDRILSIKQNIIPEKTSDIIKKVPGKYKGSVLNSYNGGVDIIRYLKRITFKNGAVEFITDSRKDLKNYTQLDEEASTGPLRLTKMIVRNTLNHTVISEVDFNQDYFNPKPEKPVNRSYDYARLSRLKLNSIVKRDVNSNAEQPYTFTYHPGTLPNKEMFSVDHWGYNNGANNKHLLPGKGFNKEDYNITGAANRAVNPQYAKIGVLTSVEYPTKGTASFEYGSNVLKSYETWVPKSYATNELSSYPDDPSDKIAFAFYVAKDTIRVNWDVELHCNPQRGVFSSNIEEIYSGISKENGMLNPAITAVTPTTETVIPLTNLEDINTVEDELTTNSFIIKDHISDLAPEEREALCNSDLPLTSYNKDIELTQGWYVFFASKGVNPFNDLTLFANFKYPDHLEQERVYEYGPGLRIERQVLDTGSALEITNYEYENFDANGNVTEHYGKLLVKPSYHSIYNGYTRQEFPLPGSIVNDISNLFIHEVRASNSVDISTIENQGVMGYKKVVHYKGDRKDNGFIESNYHHESLGAVKPVIGYHYHRVPLTKPAKNGLLTSEKYYDSNGELVSSKAISYKHIYRGTVVGVSALSRDALIGKSWANGVDSYLFSHEGPNRCGFNRYTNKGQPGYWDGLLHTNSAFYHKSYDLISSVYLPKTVREESYSTTSGDRLSSVKTYEYDENYLLPIKTTSYIEDGAIFQKDVVFNVYPFMYGSNLSGGRNITNMSRDGNYKVGTPIEVQHWSEDANGTTVFTGGQFTDINSDFLTNKVYSIYPKATTSSVSMPDVNASFSSKFSPFWDYKKELDIAYDAQYNIKEVVALNTSKIKYHWGYNKTYPVIKADNISVDLNTIAESPTILPSGFDSLEDLLLSLGNIATNSVQKQQWQAYNIALRKAVPSAMITTYTYAPLVGITSTTDARGNTTYYEYDALNRLNKVKDADGNILTEQQYHYKN